MVGSMFRKFVMLPGMVALVAMTLACSYTHITSEPIQMQETSFNPYDLERLPAPELQTRWVSFENPTGEKGQGALRNKGAKGNPYEIVYPGKSKTLLDVKGAGTIHRIWMTIDFNHVPNALRGLKVEIFWDGAETPAVSVPLGEFFGISLGRITTFENALFSSPQGRSFNCYIPMSFREGARIVVTNEQDGNEEEKIHRIFYDIDMTMTDEIPEDTMYFHASWRRERFTELGKDFEILPTVEGRGRFLGSVISLMGRPGYLGWFGEGEAKVYLDGDTENPTLCGTGTEDYIGTGWGQEVYIGRYQGALIADHEKQLHGFYRFHIPDPVFFHEDCRVTIQQLGGAPKHEVEKMIEAGMPVKPVTVITPDRIGRNLLDGTEERTFEDFGEHQFTIFYRSDDVSAVSYFYLDRPENNLPPLAPYAERVEGL